MVEVLRGFPCINGLTFRAHAPSMYGLKGYAGLADSIAIETHKS